MVSLTGLPLTHAENPGHFPFTGRWRRTSRSAAVPIDLSIHLLPSACHLGGSLSETRPVGHSPAFGGLPCGSPAYRRPLPWRIPYRMTLSRQQSRFRSGHPCRQTGQLRPHHLNVRSLAGQPPVVTGSLSHRASLRTTRWIAAITLVHPLRNKHQSATSPLSVDHPCGQSPSVALTAVHPLQDIDPAVTGQRLAGFPFRQPAFGSQIQNNAGR